MMNMQIQRRAAASAPPSIATQNFGSQMTVFFRLQDESWPLLAQSFHVPSLLIFGAVALCGRQAEFDKAALKDKINTSD
jgi:hypothetical protein